MYLNILTGHLKDILQNSTSSDIQKYNDKDYLNITEILSDINQNLIHI